MLKCVIIDDEQPSINILIDYIKKIPGLTLLGTAINPLEGIELIRSTKPDVIFLDIQMDEMNGIEVKQAIDPSFKVVFCTAYSEFAVTSYDMDAVDFLIKPIAFSRFVKAVQRVSDKVVTGTPLHDEIPNDYFYVKSDHKGKMIKIDVEDIDYIEGKSNYVAIHRGNNTTMAYLTLRDLEARLPPSRFARVHKSYIVAINHITAFENGSLILRGNKSRIPLGDSYKTIFMGKMRGKLMQ